MNIPIPRMTEAGEGEAVLLLEAGGEFHEVHQPTARNDDVLVEFLESGGFEGLRVEAPQSPEGFAGIRRGGFLNTSSAGFSQKFFEIRCLGADAGQLAVHFDNHLRLAGREFCRGAVGSRGI